MNIVNGYPPNITKIRNRFGNKAIQNAVFTYGDTCYSPFGVNFPLHLAEHERVHVKQQTNPEAWWDQYLADPQFRLEQELEAYQAQWHYIEANLNRAERRRLLKKISKDLAGPLYGGIVTVEEAKRLITA